MPFSPVPAEIKPVAHLMKIAEEHDARNIVVAYWARMAACRLALKMVPGKKSAETTALLGEILNWLERTKDENKDNEGIKSETTGQALIEEYALRLFEFAEQQDAAEIFNKNTVKTFYTAGMLFDVLEQFTLSEDLHQKQKYAKWKAAYIHNCLKSGETPQPGPPNSGTEDEKMVHISELPEEEQLRLLEEKRKMQEEQDRKRRQEEEEDLKKLNNFGNITPDAGGYPPRGSNLPGFPSFPSQNSQEGNGGFQFPKYSPGSPTIPQQPGSVTPAAPTTPQPAPQPTTYNLPPATYGTPSGGQISLTPEQIQKAQKYSKYATSALNYDDIKTAIENLQRALNLLQLGRE